MEILLAIIIVLSAAIIAKLVRHQSQPKNIKELREIAESKTAVMPPKPFTTDGCTFCPDNLFGKDVSRVCIEHDMQYWRGGSREERKMADIKLRDGVNKIIYPLGYFMYLAVRAFGHPKVPGPWRWGYGFEYPYPNKY